MRRTTILIAGALLLDAQLGQFVFSAEKLFKMNSSATPQKDQRSSASEDLMAAVRFAVCRATQAPEECTHKSHTSTESSGSMVYGMDSSGLWQPCSLMSR